MRGLGWVLTRLCRQAAQEPCQGVPGDGQGQGGEQGQEEIGGSLECRGWRGVVPEGVRAQEARHGGWYTQYYRLRVALCPPTRGHRVAYVSPQGRAMHTMIGQMPLLSIIILL